MTRPRAATVNCGGQSGEADAALSRHRVRAAGSKVKGVTFPESSKVVNIYPIAALANGNTSLVQSIDEILRARRQTVLSNDAFGKP